MYTWEQGFLSKMAWLRVSRCTGLGGRCAVVNEESPRDMSRTQMSANVHMLRATVHMYTCLHVCIFPQSGRVMFG